MEERLNQGAIGLQVIVLLLLCEVSSDECSTNNLLCDLTFVVWVFDTETECWSLMEAKGDIPVGMSLNSNACRLMSVSVHLFIIEKINLFV